MRMIPGIALAALLVACGKEEGERVPLNATSTADTTAAGPDALNAAARTALDAGNAAYRAKDYPAAVAAYRRAAAASPLHVAPWWGIQMAARAMRDTVLADSAMAKMRAISPAAASGGAPGDPHAGVPGAPGAPGTPGAGTTLPRNHPPVNAQGGAVRTRDQ